MMNALIALGLGIIIFALIAGVGLVVMANFASSVAECPTGYSWNTNGSEGVVFSQDTCCNSSGGVGGEALNCNATFQATASEGSQSLVTMTGYMQNNLVTWIPAVIALGIGLLFIGALMGRRAKKF